MFRFSSERQQEIQIMETSPSGLIQDRPTNSHELHSLAPEYGEYKKSNRENHDNEIILEQRRIKQQTQWENQLKASYEWQLAERQKYRWLQRREYEKEEEFAYELEDEAWDQLEKLEEEDDKQRKRKERWEQEQLKLYFIVEEYEKNYLEQLRQINSMEEIDEEERLKRQNALHQQLDRLEQCEQLEHTAQLEFREWLERFQQQQEQRDPINRVMNL